MCPMKSVKGCKEKCYEENITYQGKCKLCKKEQEERGVEESKIEETVYEGETSRSMFSRYKTHLESYRKTARKDWNKNSEDNKNRENDVDE